MACAHRSVEDVEVIGPVDERTAVLGVDPWGGTGVEVPLSVTDSATVRWLMADGGNGSALEAWREGVGSPAKTRYRMKPATAVDSLLVVTWNVHVGGGDVVGFVDDLRDGRLTGEPVEHFVLLLQEVHRAGMDVPSTAGPGGVPARIESMPTSGERIDVVETSRRLRLNLFYAPSMRNGPSRGRPAEDRGNAILSTVPLTAPKAIELPYEAQRRVGAVARLDGVASSGDPWAFQAVSVHLDTRSRWSRILDSFGAARLRQARGLVRSLSLDRPTVLGGDLNTWSTRRLERALPYLKERFPETPLTQEKPTFKSGPFLRLRLDHLLFRLPDPNGYRVSQVQRVDSRYGSDHFPVLAWVHFGPSPPATNEGIGSGRGGSR